MAQQRFWNFKEDDLTGLLIRWMTGLHPSGRYFGYDFVSSANMTLGLAHSTTGFKYVEAPTTAESAFLGMVVTRQGTIIIEDTALSIGTVTNGDATNPRIDTVILTHERSEIVGGTQALYSIITGVPGVTPTAPTVTDALRQTIVGTLYVPANTTLLNDVGVVWTPSQKPNFANANPLDYINLTANRATETNADGDLVASLVTNTELNVLDGMTASTAELNKLDGATPTTTEINYVDGVTSPIQTQLNGKEPTITGGATSIVTTDLAANRVLVSDALGKVIVHPTVSDTELSVLEGLTSTTAELNILDGVTATATELNHVDGVTSAIQTQLNGKEPTVGYGIAEAADNVTDLDLIVRPGVYSPITTAANTPIASELFDVIIHTASTGGFQGQLFTDISTGTIYHRSKSGGAAWTAWVSINT